MPKTLSIAFLVTLLAASVHAQEAVAVNSVNTTDASLLDQDEAAVLQATGFQVCARAPSRPQDRRKDKTKLTYATYNVEFLFLEGYGQLKCPGKDCKWKDRVMAEKHLDQIAQNLQRLDADIVQLNEVEDCKVLYRVLKALRTRGDNSYKPYLVKGKDSMTGQNSALLTRIDPSVNVQRSDQTAVVPVPDSKCPALSSTSASTKSVSKNLFTTFQVAGFRKPITVVGAHLLAQPDNVKRCAEREAQASVIAQLAQDALAQDHHVIVSGDFNDFAATVPDRNNNQPISNVLGILTNSEFVNAASKMAQKDRYTVWWDRDRDCVYEMNEVSSLDHVLVSNELAKNIQKVAFGNEWWTHECNNYQSDHFPVVVTIQAEKQA